MQHSISARKSLPLFSGLFGFTSAHAAERQVKTQLMYFHERVAVTPAITETSDGNFQISIPALRSFQPGKYTLHTSITTDGKTYATSQDFSWGVLAMNTKKSVYAPGETIQFGFAVLDDMGETLCHASLELQITIPSENSKIYSLSSENGLIKASNTCGHNNITNAPDYTAQFQSKGAEETYLLHLKADTGNGIRYQDDTLKITKQLPVRIERTIFPMRINPKAEYPVVLTIYADEDYQGTISDTLPEAISVGDISDKGSVRSENYTKIISWPVELQQVVNDPKGRSCPLWGLTPRLPSTALMSNDRISSRNISRNRFVHPKRGGDGRGSSPFPARRI